jgi:hypothetical protein
VDGAFNFIVADTYLIEGRGVIVAPFFPFDQFQFDLTERTQIDRPDGSTIQAIANFHFDTVGRPRTIKALCVFRGLKKDDIPIGSKIVLIDKTVDQVRSSQK